MELALYVLGSDPAWNRNTLQEALDTGRERTVMLPRPLPVHILYWTAFVNDEREMEFRRDLYGRDARLEAALKRKP
jgi:murein L,D-transpeptidase YcbB/YkuD